MAGLLDRVDLIGDLLGRARRLVGQVLYLRGDDGEALACLAGASGFDGGVQGQQLGLGGDLLDQADDLADAFGGIRQTAHGLVGGQGFLDGVARDAAGLLDLAGDFLDRGGQLLGGGGHGLDVG